MRTPPPRDDLRFSNTTGILQKKTMWFIGVEVEQETSAPPPQKILDPPLITSGKIEQSVECCFSILLKPFQRLKRLNSSIF